MDHAFQNTTTCLPLDVGYFLNPADCRQKWKSFLETPSHELKADITELMGHLEGMQNSYTKDSLTASATAIEASNAWKRSTVLQEWFQTVWLPLAKVGGVRL